MNKRFRDYGFNPGFLPTGERNTIADVAGVRIGHVTHIEGDDVRTGLTLVDPGVPNLYAQKIPAAIAIENGAGKVAGISEVEEFGFLRAPVALTNTHAVGAVIQGIIDLVGTQTILPFYGSVNAVVGEVNDTILNNIHKCSIEPEDVFRAFENLSEHVAFGCVGGGTGTRAFTWKGGIGSASRVVEVAGQMYTIGVLAQTNYGGNLTIMGVPIGRFLGEGDSSTHPIFKRDGSCMIVLATDAPLTARQLKRLAKRSSLGLARTGSIVPTASGDYTIAFSTNRSGLEGAGEIGACLSDDTLNPFFLACVEAVEESVYDALFMAETMTGRDGNVLEALPKDRVVEILTRVQKSYDA